MTEYKKRLKYIYIIGAGHSGTTLLDLAISNQERIFSLGEFRHVQSEWKDNNPCSCGEPIRSCPIWSKVLSDFSEEELWVLASRDYHLKKKDPRNVPDLFVKVYPRFLKKLVEVTGCEAISDSSKSFHKLSLIALIPDIDLRILYLRRHVGGVAASQRRKGKSALKAGLFWLIRNIRILRYLNDSVLPWSEVVYEELASNPEKELKKIFQFIEVDFKYSLVTNFTKLRHIVKGNRIRDSHTKLSFHRPSVWQKRFSPIGADVYEKLYTLFTFSRGNRQ